MGYQIITDSASDITIEEAARLGVRVLPVRVSFGESEYRDGEDLSRAAFYEKLAAAKELPKTGQATAYEYGEAFRAALEEGDEVLCITMAAALSGTYQSACIAAQETGGAVTVLDSGSVSAGQKLAVLRAAEYRGRGLSREETAEAVRQETGAIRFFALLDTLEYLKKGGRISAAAAAAGGVLAVKPLIEVRGGAVRMAGKARGTKNGYRLLNETAAACGIDRTKPVILAYSGADEAILAGYRAESAALIEGCPETLVSGVGCSIGVHAGPGAVGIAFFSENL